MAITIDAITHTAITASIHSHSRGSSMPGIVTRPG
jgi:hypothetical protein